MKVTELKNQLNAMEKNELIALIVKLYKNDKMCRNILDAEFGGEEVQAVLLANAKKQLYDIFFSKHHLVSEMPKQSCRDLKRRLKIKRIILTLNFIMLSWEQHIPMNTATSMKRFTAILFRYLPISVKMLSGRAGVISCIL